MASDEGDNEAEQKETHEPRECMACRGSGRVISNLGGTPSEVQCPWCAGSGVRAAGIDAQAHWPANSQEVDAAAPSAPGAADALSGDEAADVAPAASQDATRAPADES